MSQAEELHQGGRRKRAPMVRIQCGLLSPRVAAQQLFGYAAGTLPGCDGGAKGAIACASGGTLLLVDLDQLDLALQARLAEVLDQQSILAEGGAQRRGVNVQCIATTSLYAESIWDADLIHPELRRQFAVVTARDHAGIDAGR